MGKSTWIVTALLGIASTLNLAAAKASAPPPTACNVFLQANGKPWAATITTWADRIPRQHDKGRWAATIYNYRLVLAQTTRPGQDSSSPADLLNPQWSKPLFKILQTQNKFQQHFLRYMSYVLNFRPEQLIGPQAAFGRSMRYQILGQIKLVLTNIEEHREVLPFFEDSFWAQLHNEVAQLAALLKNPDTTRLKDVAQTKTKLQTILAAHTTLLPPQLYQTLSRPKNNQVPQPTRFPAELLLKLEELHYQLQLMSFFVHPLYQISPAERFVLQLIYYRKMRASTKFVEGDYYQAIDPIYHGLPYSDVQLSRLLVKLQAHQRRRQQNLLRDQQITIPAYQQWQDNLVASAGPNFIVHNLYRELLVTFLEARQNHEQYPDSAFHKLRVLLGRIQQQFNELWQLDYQLTAPVHRLELEHLQHALLVYDLRHKIKP